MRVYLDFICLIFLLCFSGAILCQTTIDLFPSQDNTIFEESGDESLGASGYLFAGRTASLNNSNSRRALIKFDLSGIPENAIISEAEIRLVVDKAPNTNSHLMKIHKLNASWGEGDSGSGVSGGAGVQALDDDVTWSHRFYNSNQMWQVPGGDFITLPSAVSFIQWDVNSLIPSAIWNSSGLVSDVQDWIDGTSDNNGWIIVGDESKDFTAKKFVSREENNIFIDIRPKLTVTYSIPGAVVLKSPILNEVNLHDEWIEIYNGTDEVFDLSSWSLCQGTTCNTINGIDAPIIHGDAILDTSEFIIVRWSSLNTTSGEIVLQSSVGGLDTTDMVDYLQYGSANHPNAEAAVIKSFWDDINSSLSIPATYKNSLSVTSDTDFTNGQKTNASNWNIWGATASLENNQAPTNMILENQIVGASYIATDQITINGHALEFQIVELEAPNGINLNSGVTVDSSAVLQAIILD